MNRPDCWEILGINPTRNLDRIRDAFRKKAKLYHPDTSPHFTSKKEKYNFIEIKAVTYCGKSDASSLTIQNSPWHTEVCSFSESIAERLKQRGNSVIYSIATEHEHSCCILLAREDKFKIDGVWHTWIDYPKFAKLSKDYYDTQGCKSFSSIECLLINSSIVFCGIILIIFYL